MSQDEFTKLFKYMEERFNRIDEALENKADKKDIEKLLNAVDSFAKRQEYRWRRKTCYGPPT